MSVRKTSGLNQPDPSSGKVTTARFDRFSRGSSGEIHTVAGAETRTRGGARSGEYTQVVANMCPVKRAAPAVASAVAVAVAR